MTVEFLCSFTNIYDGQKLLSLLEACKKISGFFRTFGTLPLMAIVLV
jgi:hypothetical protein